MKLLQLNLESGWRGGERQTLLCMQMFRQAGQSVTLLARRGGALAQKAKDQGFDVYECRGPLGVLGFLLFRGRRYDVWHAQTANTLTWLVLLKGLLGRPVVFTRRTAFTTSSLSKKTYFKWRLVDRFVAISQAAAQAPQAAHLNVTLIPSAVVAQPINSARVRSLSTQYGLSAKKIVATAAALTAEKDPETLVRAIAKLAQTRDDFIFVHLGADGDQTAVVRALLKRLGLEQRYILAGFQDGMADWYQLMDVFVSASRYEALGTSVLDAFLYDVPVVTTNAGGLAELAAEGRALVCSVGDANCLAASIGRVLDGGSWLEEQQRRARVYVEQQHAPTEMARRYLELYSQL